MSLLVAALALLGFGNASAQLSRYAAADLFPVERRAFALSIVVWGGTVGALVGPNLIAPAATLAEDVGLPADAGSFLLAVGTTAIATTVATTLPRARVADTSERGRLSWPMLRAATRTSTVALAVTAMVTAQLVMVAVMTMTPLQLHAHGHGLDVVGWVLSAHLAGMFALSPVSGRLTDRFGARATIVGGAVLLVVANAVAFAAPTSHALGLPVALFLLGYGWNLCFVGGSGLLSGDLPEPVRVQLQGGVEAVVWGSSAIGSLAAGPIFASAGYASLALMAALLAAIPLALVRTRRGAEPLSPVAPESGERTTRHAPESLSNGRGPGA
jgi:MFS family permease